MKKLSDWLFYVFIFFFLIFVVYSYRTIFLTPYDNSYLRDLYDHSQWNMAISKRPVSDNIVYEVTAFDLVHNWSFFKIDPQTPVLGKYLYGLSISIFKNAETILIFVLLLTMLVFYQISKLVLKNDYLAKLSLFLFTMEPIIFYQISQSMLDLPQLFFLLVHVLSLLKLQGQNKKSRFFFWLVIAGLSLGGFISIKIGFFSAAIVIADLIFLYKNKKTIYLLPIVFISFITYIFSYFPYFLMNHSFLEFLRNQKWIIVSYWLSSKSQPILGMVFLSTLTGFIKGWYKGSTWERVKEWTIFWPLYLIFFTALVAKRLKEIDDRKLYLTTISLFLILMYAFVPFNARYLVLVIPFLIVLSAGFIKTVNRLILIPLVIVFFFQIVFFLKPAPNDVSQTIKEIWKNSAYQDLYSYLDNKTKDRFSRSAFWRLGQTFEKNLGATDKKIVIYLPITYFWQNYAKGDLVITYKTFLGTVTNKKKIIFVRENNSWKINWQDSLLLNNFDFEDQIITKYEEGSYGTLISKSGKILSRAESWPVFSVIHKNIKDEAKVQEQLTKFTELKKHDIEYLYKANMQPDWKVEIGYLKPNLSPTILDKYAIDKAIIIDNKVTRIHNRQYLIPYPQLDPILGGEIILKKRDGKIKTIIKKNKVDGQNIVYEKSI
ncbi:hypothetical protein HZA76_03315 [Candidatus Roizmanbacteria bacterium]|nr:hypothetical protein [Candidatus Roizmanbacteria bacterium]